MSSLSLKVVLISSLVLFLGFVLKISVPLFLDFSTSQAPVIWSSILLWLKPPYLYVIINGIIITIVATSRFFQNHEDHHHHGNILLHAPKNLVESSHPLPYDYEMIKRRENMMEEIRFGHLESTVVMEEEQREEVAVFEEKNMVVVNNIGGDSDEFVVSKSMWVPPKRTESEEILSGYLSPAEKPLVSSRFCHRKPVKSSPEGGRALRVSKPKRHETLEHTWKTITEGRAMPLTRHLKKSDTWENNHHGRQVNVSNVDPSALKKLETFKDRTNYQSPPVTTTPSPLKLRKEPSLSQDELNKRVEAFIKKFNEEMRLQRQESLNQYKEMINRGAH